MSKTNVYKPACAYTWLAESIEQYRPKEMDNLQYSSDLRRDPTITPLPVSGSDSIVS
jgi:hypothetical protein